MDEELEKLAITLFKIDCLLFGKFVSSNGWTINTYFDLGIIVSHPDVMNELCRLSCELLRKNKIWAPSICGVSYSAISFAVGIANKLRVPLYMRTKEIQLSSTEPRIVGEIAQSTEVVVVEEVISSGTSVLQVIKDIEDTGMVVKNILIIVDLGEGGCENLSKLGYNCHVLLKISEMGRILYKNHLIDEDRLEKIRQGNSNDFVMNGDCITKTILADRIRMNYESRMNCVKSTLSKNLFRLMLKKKTNLCVDLSLPDIDSIISVADEIGPSVCIMSIHLNAFNQPPSSYQIKELRRLATKHDFLLMDDCKLSEAGDVLQHQLRKMFKTVDLVTVLPLATGCIEEVSRFLSSMPEKGVILTGFTFTEDAFVKLELEQSVIKSGLSECTNGALVGFFSHQNSPIPLEYVHLMSDMRTTGATCGKANTEYYTDDTMTEKLAADIVTVHFDETENIVRRVEEQKRSFWAGYENRSSEVRRVAEQKRLFWAGYENRFCEQAKGVQNEDYSIK